MINELLAPILAWLGIGLVPFLILVLIIIVLIRG